MRPGEAGVLLSVDYGTSNTVAVLRWPDGRVRPLLFDGSPLLPSAVYRNADGTLVVGPDAVHSARLDPACYEPNPRLRIDDGTVPLGDAEVPVVELVAATLRLVATEAQRAAGAPPAAVTMNLAWYHLALGPRVATVLLLHTTTASGAAIWLLHFGTRPAPLPAPAEARPTLWPAWMLLACTLRRCRGVVDEAVHGSAVRPRPGDRGGRVLTFLLFAARTAAAIGIIRLDAEPTRVNAG